MVGEVLGNGEGGHGVDLLFAHDAHALRAELVGVIDGDDTGLDRVESSGLAGAMVGCGEFAIGHAVGAGLINLDKVRALFELLPYHGDQSAGIVGVGGIGG